MFSGSAAGGVFFLSLRGLRDKQNKKKWIKIYVVFTCFHVVLAGTGKTARLGEGERLYMWEGGRGEKHRGRGERSQTCGR